MDLRHTQHGREGWDYQATHEIAMATAIKVDHETKERKVGVARLYLRPMPTADDYDTLSELARQRVRELTEVDERITKDQLLRQAIVKDLSMIEDERWQMRITMNRWNKAAI